ncbi:MAG: sulfite exporter TauE/SafE family protein [Firmicutes bacterium]|nr:sulfite exporter TauE/SafE family protein [Bacillota bacterium]
MHFGIFANDGLFALALFIVAGAFFIRGVIGFGSGLIAVSLMIFFLPIKFVVPLIFILDTLASAALGSYDYKEIRWKEVIWLLPFASLGVLAGGYILKNVSAQKVTAILGAFILLYVLYTLLVKLDKYPPIAKKWAVPLGFLGGLAGSLYGGGGPPLVAYLQMRHLTKRHFRATMQVIAILNNLMRGVMYLFIGFLTWRIFTTSLWLLPAMVAGLWFGNRIHLAISAKKFQQATLIVLTLAGIKLLLPS